jgi:hypothetical protein
MSLEIREKAEKEIMRLKANTGLPLSALLGSASPVYRSVPGGNDSNLTRLPVARAVQTPVNIEV